MTIPNSEEYFLKQPIYTKYSISDGELYYFRAMMFWTSKLIAYCTQCARELVFNKQNSPEPTGIGGGHSPLPSIFNFINVPITTTFQCSNVHSHKMVFTTMVFADPDVKNVSFMKIGQFPSIADIEIAKNGNFRKYSKVISKDQVREFSTAIGLASHGVGNGSFVYLRRIFESLIEDTHKTATMIEENWDEQSYSKMRMPEKIEALAQYLPTPLVDDYQLYAILSKGIHELSEEECLNYFGVVRTGIQLMLDDIVEKREKEERVKAYEREKQKIIREI